jgi:hypothetical protein
MIMQVKKKFMQGKIKTILYAMQMMDMCHVPHGEDSGFESRAGLSIPSVRLSSPDGVLSDDTFFCHTFFGVGCASTFTSYD